MNLIKKIYEPKRGSIFLRIKNVFICFIFFNLNLNNKNGKNALKEIYSSFAKHNILDVCDNCSKPM